MQCEWDQSARCTSNPNPRYRNDIPWWSAANADAMKRKCRCNEEIETGGDLLRVLTQTSEHRSLHLVLHDCVSERRSFMHSCCRVPEGSKSHNHESRMAALIAGAPCGQGVSSAACLSFFATGGIGARLCSFCSSLLRERCANTTINSNTAGSSSSVSRPDNSPEGSSNRNHKLSTITRDSANTQGSNNGSHHSSMAANSNASNSAKDLSDSNAHSNKATKAGLQQTQQERQQARAEFGQRDISMEEPPQYRTEANIQNQQQRNQLGQQRPQHQQRPQQQQRRQNFTPKAQAADIAPHLTPDRY
jgi:hypothetical protein